MACTHFLPQFVPSDFDNFGFLRVWFGLYYGFNLDIASFYLDGTAANVFSPFLTAVIQNSCMSLWCR